MQKIIFDSFLWEAAIELSERHIYCKRKKISDNSSLKDQTAIINVAGITILFFPPNIISILILFCPYQIIIIPLCTSPDHRVIRIYCVLRKPLAQV
jgi:hypothetical protein